MKKDSTVVGEMSKVVDETTEAVSGVVYETEKQIEKTVAPVRKQLIHRFPTLFLLLVTAGFTATITGMEQIILQNDFLQNNPSVVLIIGLGLLVLTGTLYKKIG